MNRDWYWNHLRALGDANAPSAPLPTGFRGRGGDIIRPGPILFDFVQQGPIEWNPDQPDDASSSSSSDDDGDGPFDAGWNPEEPFWLWTAPGPKDGRRHQPGWWRFYNTFAKDGPPGPQYGPYKRPPGWGGPPGSGSSGIFKRDDETDNEESYGNREGGFEGVVDS
ncbi:hypothetical protein TWF281_006884 [Arthrobotrys megalospora]